MKQTRKPIRREYDKRPLRGRRRRKMSRKKPREKLRD